MRIDVKENTDPVTPAKIFLAYIRKPAGVVDSIYQQWLVVIDGPLWL